MTHSIQERWDIFVEKITNRQTELLDAAANSLPKLLVDSEYDYRAITRAWHAMHTQIETLETKVEDTFDAVVFMDDSIASAVQDKLAIQTDIVRANLRAKLLTAEAVIFGNISEMYFSFVIKKELETKHSCKQCSASIQIQTDLFRAQYISCTFCQTTNTITPDTRFIIAGLEPTDHKARYQLLDLYTTYAKQEAHTLYQTKQAPPTNEFKKTYTTYYTKWHEKRALINSELADILEEDIEKTLGLFTAN